MNTNLLMKDDQTYDQERKNLTEEEDEEAMSEEKSKKEPFKDTDEYDSYDDNKAADETPEE